MQRVASNLIVDITLLGIGKCGNDGRQQLLCLGHHRREASTVNTDAQQQQNYVIYKSVPPYPLRKLRKRGGLEVLSQNG